MINAHSATIETPNNRLIIFLCFYALLAPLVLHATSVVYNLRIRRVFLPQGLIPKTAPYRHWLATAVPIIGKRTDSHLLNNDREDVLYGGSVFNMRYRFNPNWGIEGTTAVLGEKVDFSHNKIHGCSSASGFDDIVLNVFSNLFPTSKNQCIIHILAGFPTNKKLSIFEGYNRLVGTKLFSLGGGVEGSFTFSECDKSGLFGVLQARIIHFFERNLMPLLPKDGILHPGNITDFFAALHYRYKRHHLEGGYDGTLYTNGRIGLVTSVNKVPHFLRNSFYGSYIYIIRQRGAVGGGGSVQFVRTPFTSKGFNLWVNGTVSF